MTQLLSALPLAYMAAACYYSLFQLGMFSFYHVVPHATNAHSLLMNAAQVCPSPPAQGVLVCQEAKSRVLHSWPFRVGLCRLNLHLYS